MKLKLAALLAVSAMLAASAVSCGNDEPAESSVPDFPELSATEAEDNTEAETEAATEAETEAETKEAAETTKAVTTSAAETSTEAIKTEEADTEESTPDEPEESVQPDVQPDEPVADPEPEPVQEPVQEPEPEPQSVVFSADMLNGDAGAVVAALGGNPSIETAPACFSNGADSKTYTYDGLVLQCYVLNGVEYVYAFTITSSGYTAENGITVGSSRGDVESYYGAGEAAGNDVRYIYDSYDMTITYNGDTVTVIDFYAPV